MEDCQPNEVRLDRKGKSFIPAIKVVRRGGYHGSFRGLDSSRGHSPVVFNHRHRGHHPIRPDFRNYPSTSSSNASGQAFGQTELEHSRSFARSGQHLFNRMRYGSQQFPRDSHKSRSPRQGPPRADVSLDRSPQFPKYSNREIQPVFREMAQNSHAVHIEQDEVLVATQYESFRRKTPAIRKPSHRNKGANVTRNFRMKKGYIHGGDSLEAIPVESMAELQASRSAAIIPPLVMPSSTSLRSRMVLDSQTDSSSQPQRLTLPSDRNAALSRSVFSAEIVGNIVDSPDDPVNIPLEVQPRFFRSGVLKIASAFSKTTSEISATFTAKSNVLRDNNAFSDDVSIRDLASRESNLVRTLQEDGTCATVPSQTMLPIPSSIITPVSSRMPLDMHDKPRRVFAADWNLSLFTVSMHGFVESLDSSSLKFRRNLRKPAAPAQESVDDACLLHAGDTPIVVLAHAREEKQISYLTFQNGEETSLRIVDRPWTKTKKGGTSAVSTMMQPLTFASGGHDHAVHIWNFSEDLMSVSSTHLAIKHTSMIQSLLPIRDTSHKLISAGADCNVHLWDLSSERVMHTFKTSNSPYHAHKTESPFCTLLEVGHRDLQFELRDHRMVPEHPAQRFGFYTTDLHGRFMKGDTWSYFFASGSRNGSVRLWDLRNIRGQPALVSCFNNDQVVQVLKTQSNLLAFSKRGDMMTLDYDNMVHS